MLPSTSLTVDTGVTSATRCAGWPADGARGDADTLVACIRRHAAEHGPRRAVTFLQDGERETGHLTFAMLDERARSIAGWLQANGHSGERVLLMFPSSLDFVVAFLGCLYAGVVAVPIYPPKQNRGALRLRGVMEDARPSLALTTAQVKERIRPLLKENETGLGTLRLAAADALQRETPDAWRMPDIHGGSLAFLQYTSGSTSDPKGVMVSHANVLANHRMMQRMREQTPQGCVVTWLPMFHDMGLIANLLQALCIGCHCIFMPPEAFLARPYRWLAAVSKYRATLSSAPNFAYDLCVRKITEEQRRSLDLSSWETVEVAAEPVRHATLERFTAAFEPCGFRGTAFNPCFGLAEATVFVSSMGKGTGFQTTSLCARALEQHRIIEKSDGAPHELRVFVNCGHAWLDEQIAIVDPETRLRCAPDRIGEVWVAGSHVAQGYWHRAEETKHVFHAGISGEPGTRYLRTGDLGFFRNGGLHIAGRIKDTIVIAGRNHDPADIELTAGAAHSAVRSGGCAAFQAEVDDEDRLILAVELERTSGVFGSHGSHTGVEGLMDDLRQAVAEEHGLSLHEVVLLKPGALPRTSSGKIQRHACRKAWCEGTLSL